MFFLSPKKYILGIAIGLFTVISAVTAFAADEPESVIDEKYTLPYLEQVIAWYRNMSALEISPGDPQEMLFEKILRKNSAKALNAAFDFAKIEAKILDAKEESGPSTEVISTNANVNIAKVAAEAEKKAKALQAELNRMASKIQKASKQRRSILIAKQEKQESELKLVKARQELLQTIMGSAAGTSTEETGLLGKINNLARSIPEVLNEEQRASATKSEISPAIQPSQDTTPLSAKGIFGLTSDMYAMSLKHKTITNLIDANSRLRYENQKILDILRDQLKDQVKQGDDISKENRKEDKKSLTLQKQQLDQLVQDYKHLSNLVIPLRKVNMWLDASKKNLEDWQHVLDRQSRLILEQLLVKLGILGIALLIPTMLSIVAQNATVKYVKNIRLQRQLKTIRRSVFAGVIGLVVILNLISESGSLITFAGLLTAGIAVALQTVILSLVAHFFFIGKFGVRVGDRISIGGVTGEVIKMGVVRLYLMELAGTDYDLNPTGKIIAYPNSVLFQPAAFIKLIPGTNYSWNEIKLTLDPNIDYHLANEKLMEAVQNVYKDYHDIMRKQEYALQKATDSEVTIPLPQAHLRLTDAGLSFIVRYPIEISKAAEIRERMTKELLRVMKTEHLTAAKAS